VLPTPDVEKAGKTAGELAEAMEAEAEVLELGACKELEGHIFTIGSGNKGKDGDMMRTSH
jgi:hypothetical protein